MLVEFGEVMLEWAPKHECGEVRLNGMCMCAGLHKCERTNLSNHGTREHAECRMTLSLYLHGCTQVVMNIIKSQLCSTQSMVMDNSHLQGVATRMDVCEDEAHTLPCHCNKTDLVYMDGRVLTDPT